LCARFKKCPLPTPSFGSACPGSAGNRSVGVGAGLAVQWWTSGIGQLANGLWPVRSTKNLLGDGLALAASNVATGPDATPSISSRGTRTPVAVRSRVEIAGDG